MLKCTACGSDDLEANTWEAWCYSCGTHWTNDDEPITYQAIRDATLKRHQEAEAALIAAGLLDANGRPINP